eukprot:jgi/Chlat1/6534/Chrsp45S06014
MAGRLDGHPFLGRTEARIDLMGLSSGVAAKTAAAKTNEASRGCCGFFYSRNIQSTDLPPSRISPKAFFSNERTFLRWLHVVVTIGSIGAAVSTFAMDPQMSPLTAQVMSFVGIVLLPVAIVFAVYAAWMFYMRAYALHHLEIGPFDDRLGPNAVAGALILALSVILVRSIIQIFFDD